MIENMFEITNYDLLTFSDCRFLKEMSDSEGEDGPERVAKNCLKQLLDSTNSLVAKADEDETEDAKAVIEQGTSLFKTNQS